MSDQQQREKLEALAAENSKLRPENAQLKRALDRAKAERNALLYELSTHQDTGTLCEALSHRCMELEAELKAANKVIDDSRAELRGGKREGQ